MTSNVQRIVIIFVLLLAAGFAFISRDNVHAQASNASTLASILNTPLCPDVFSVAPENPAFISPNEGVRYSWSGEPSGTARRDFVAYDNFPQDDGSFLSSGLVTVEAAGPLEHTTSLTAGNVLPGTYNWLAIFYGADGNPICRTNTHWLDVRGGGGSDASTGSGGGSSGSILVETACGWVVVFQGGPADGVVVADQSWGGGNDFTVATDSTSSDLSCNHEIHGNNAPNIITGGDGDDQIFGYAGNDTLLGEAGNDSITGGDETCTGNFCTPAGGLGDTIDGGEGNDTLNGGNETCDGDFCVNSETLGDTIDGGPGNDLINGGNESCNGQLCVDGQAIGDNINGGDGADTLNGGDESCTGPSCGAGTAMLGDDLNANDAANNPDGDADILNGEVGNDHCQSTAEDNPANAGGGDC